MVVASAAVKLDKTDFSSKIFFSSFTFFVTSFMISCLILSRWRLTQKVNAIAPSVIFNGGPENEKSGRPECKTMATFRSFSNCTLEIVKLIFEDLKYLSITACFGLASTFYSNVFVCLFVWAHHLVMLVTCHELTAIFPLQDDPLSFSISQMKHPLVWRTGRLDSHVCASVPWP